MNLVPGTRLGPYEILSLLGAGGMGEVYKATDTRLQRFVAIKTMRGAFGERFEREARAISALNHPHICALHDIGDVVPVLPSDEPRAQGDEPRAAIKDRGAVRFLVMEYVEGKSPAGPLPIDIALSYARDIASALEAAHKAGIIHRDLKPANILVTEQGIKLLDFGLAKLTHGNAGVDSAVGLTEPHMVMGTPQYMSPEQIQGQPVDARSDLFSFGCVLYELISGRPFVGDSPIALMNAIVTLKPAPLSGPGTQVPPPVESVVMRCLMKDPFVRWQSARELIDAIDRVSADLTPAPPLAAPRPSAMIGWIRHYALIIMISVIAFGLAVTIALNLRSGPALPTGPVGSTTANGALRFPVQAGPGSRRDAAADTFAVSPDGTAIAFNARQADGVSAIWVRRFNDPAAILVAGTEGGIQPFWSPDARAIGFFREQTLMVVERESGQVRTVAPLPGAESPAGASWAEGQIAFALVGRGVFAVSDRGGAVTSIEGSTATRGHAAYTWPQLLPDGQYLIAYAATDVGGAGVSLLPVGGGDPRRLVQSVGAANYVSGALVFPRVGSDGVRQIVQSPFDLEHLRVSSSVRLVQPAIVAAAGGASGFSAVNGVLAAQQEPRVRHQLAWFDRAGHTVDVVGSEGGVEDFDLAPDGQRVVASIRDPATRQADLWLVDNRRGEVIRLTTRGGERPLWSRDGRYVFFSSPADHAAHRATIESATDDVFTLVGPLSHFEDLTRDGRYFILKTLAEPSEIWLQHADDPGEHRTLVKDAAAASSPRVAPNGRWLAFTLSAGANRDVFVQPFDRPGERVRISNHGGFNPVWRDDSRELFYETADALMAVSIADERGAPVPAVPSRALGLHTQGAVRNLPHNVEASGGGSFPRLTAVRFLVNTVIGESDNAPIDVSLNWKP